MWFCKFRVSIKKNKSFFRILFKINKHILKKSVALLREIYNFYILISTKWTNPNNPQMIEINKKMQYFLM